ncbi:MAG: type II secretion system protein [bacterium]|nr:type II secretion system protein [bacterium]
MKKGFTLIELMLVVAIIGILLVLFLPRATRMMDKSRERTTARNLKSIKLALDQYCEQSDGAYAYPETGESFKEILEQGFPDGIVPRAVLRMGAVDASNACYVVGSPTDIPISPEGGWVLINAGPYRGNIYINSTDNDTNKNPYTTYSCW